MKKAVVEWAKAHDWYVGCEMLPTGPGLWEGGEWKVYVRDWDVLGQEVVATFTSFQALRQWAGY